MRKILIAIGLTLLFGCASKEVKIPEANKAHIARFRAGDCVSIQAMHITDQGEWDSSGFGFGDFKIVEIIKTDKMNTYMAERLHANEFYKISLIFRGEDKKYAKYHKGKFYVIPVEDLDGLRYSDKWWPGSYENTDKCNEYSQEK